MNKSQLKKLIKECVLEFFANDHDVDHGEDEFEHIIKQMGDKKFDIDELGGVVYGYLSELSVVHKEDLIMLHKVLVRNGIESDITKEVISDALSALNINK